MGRRGATRSSSLHAQDSQKRNVQNETSLNEGKVTLTHIEAPTRDRAGAGDKFEDLKSWDDFAGYPFLKRVGLYWRANPGLQDLLLYLFFVVIFSIVSFASKPGVQEYYLNNLHRSNLGRDFTDIRDWDTYYSWLKTTFADQAFPLYSPDGEPLDEIQRLMISGRARVLGAMRLRQVRSRSRECKVHESLETVSWYDGDIMCNEEYSYLYQSIEPIHDENSTERDKLLDFTRPFEYRSTTELNTTLLFIEGGNLDSYYQDGYALDIIPNVAPNVLADYFYECEGIMNQSITECMREQNVFPEEVIVTPPAPPAPVPPPLSSDEEPVIVIKTDTDDNGLPTDYAFLLERTVTLTSDNPQQDIQFQLKNNGVTTINWEAKFYNSTGHLLERWQEEVLWLSEDLNDQGSLECTELNCDPVRFKISVRAGQVSYLLNDAYVKDGQRVHAPNSPLEIVFQGTKGWEMKQATLKLNVFLDRTGATDGAKRRRRLQQDIGEETETALPCFELASVQDVTPRALVTDECKKIPDDLDLCKLDDLSFQQMYDFFGTDRCSGCKCRGPQDKACVESCSAKELFKMQVDHLAKGTWIDQHTRAVILDVNLFNSNYNLFTNFRAIIEVQSTGYIWPSLKLRTFKLYRYQTSYDWFVAVCEIIFIGLVMFYFYQEISEIRKQGWSYFSHGWNYVDWINLSIALAVIILRCIALNALMSFGSFSSTAVSYIDFPPLGAFAASETNVISINFFLIYFKIFKYLEAVPRMGSILKTLSTAFVDLSLFLVLVVVLFFGFASAFYVCFGAEVYNWRTLSDSIGALNRAVLGDFDYYELVSANAVMARILFYSFVFVSVFVVLAIFLALINDAYAEVKADEPDNVQIFQRITDQMFKRRNQVEALKNKLEDGDMDGDNRITLDELRDALVGNQRALAILDSTSVEDLLAKYDVDDDGELSREELLEILSELAEKEAEIEGQIETREKSLEKQATTMEDRDLTPEQRSAAKNKLKLKQYDDRLNVLTMNINELSKNIAKKLSTMIDLMVALSSQVSSDALPNSEISPPAWAA